MKKITFLTCLFLSSLAFSYQLPTTEIMNNTMYDFVITRVGWGAAHCHVADIFVGMTWSPGQTIHIEGECENASLGLDIDFNVPYASEPWYGLKGVIRVNKDHASVSYPSQVSEIQRKQQDGEIKYNLTLDKNISITDGNQRRKMMINKQLD